MNNKEQLERMKELVELLNKASKSYYANNQEIMSNREYDELYDELVSLEEITNVIIADSPTVNVGYEAVDELPKERHESAMLSLGKTKEREELKTWLKDKKGLLSWKLDGLTVVLTYTEGKLSKAVTRGNGEIGEVITNNARTFKNIPLSIPYQGNLIVRGEAVITYSVFNKINQEIPGIDNKYKNPRNLCSGSVRQLNNRITADRNVNFFAFSLVAAESIDFNNSRKKQYDFLKEQGFEVVEYLEVDVDSILDAIDDFAERINSYDVPSDGLVLAYDDLKYSISLGTTAKFPRDSIAFKWADELKETNLIEIEWSASRTGLINPVAVFEPVELEGTTVSRASVHNVSIVRKLKLGIGDRITVYKANMIIPQINENLSQSDTIEIPKECPVCGKKTELRKMNDVQVLYCTNPNCTAKRIKSFTQFVSRDALNMDGLSEATIEKFIHRGFIHDFSDLFHLNIYEDEIVEMDGFGEKSFQNIMECVERARHTSLARLICGLGIANIGVSNAKMLDKYFNHDIDRLLNASVDELSDIEGVGKVIADAIWEYFHTEQNIVLIKKILNEIVLDQNNESNAEQNLVGLTFVITGSLQRFSNRDELKDIIENHGGKVTNTVTSKTSALINNDTMSSSSKNKKAMSLNISILSEDEFLNKYDLLDK